MARNACVKNLPVLLRKFNHGIVAKSLASSNFRSPAVIGRAFGDSTYNFISVLRSSRAWNAFVGRHFCGIGIRYRAYSDSEGKEWRKSEPDLQMFGDPTANSGVTDNMLDSLIALKDFGDIEGLPPLDEILKIDHDKDRKAMRRELEKKKQLELERNRVKTVDNLGRAYATGRRKCSAARVWIWEGGGKMTINGLPFDVYFPNIDNRAQLMSPLLAANQLGVFNIRATVQGGGTTGQCEAIRHGISKALQLFDPSLRPPLKSAGLLTRDSRVVERKKPGKAKARKSFQWVKR